MESSTSDSRLISLSSVVLDALWDEKEFSVCENCWVKKQCDFIKEFGISSCTVQNEEVNLYCALDNKFAYCPITGQPTVWYKKVLTSGYFVEVEK